MLAKMLIPSIGSIRNVCSYRFDSKKMVRDDPFLTLIIVEEFGASKVEQLPSLEPFFLLPFSIALLE